MRKICSKCNEEHDLLSFYKDKNHKDGHRCSCKFCDINKAKKWNSSNLDEHKRHQANWRTNNRQASRDQRIKYAETDKGKKSIKKWFSNNKEKVRNSIRINLLSRRKTDPIYKMRTLMSTQIRKAIIRNGFTKRSKTGDILGCSWIEFKEYLESKFYNDMNWNNKDKWDIDHIIPCVSAKNEEDLLKLQHYTNLQPLWKTDHKKKTKEDIRKYR